jgi:hypothetical protein
MSTIKSSDEHLTLNADGSSKDIKFQANGVEKASISSAGAFTSTTIDATKLTGNLPAISGASLTSLPADSTKLPLAGGTMTGNTLHGDNVASYYGTSNDLQIRHSGSHSYIQDAGTGDLIIKSNGTDVKIIGDNDEDIAKFTWNAGVDIYHNNSKVFTTHTYGFKTGNYDSETAGRGVRIYQDGDQGQVTIRSTSTANRDAASFCNGNGRVGSIKTNGTATSFNTSSDYRLKENVDYTWDATTRLKQLKPARFNFIADDSVTVDGFIAHEVSSVVPEAISGEKDAVDDDGNAVHQGIDQSKLVPLLVKTIQELEARITALES